MEQVKRPKKPLMFYYTIVLIILILFNIIAMPYIKEKQIKDVRLWNIYLYDREKGDKKSRIGSNRIIRSYLQEKTGRPFTKRRWSMIRI